MKKILAISGWKQAGKDTCANYLVDNYSYRRYAFVDILKDKVAEEYDVPRNHFDDSEFKEKPILTMPVETKDSFTATIHGLLAKELISGFWTPRALVILEGSIKRSVASSYWTSKVISEVNKLDTNCVISDLRYKSEAEQLRKAFGDDLLTIRINRFKTVESIDPSERDLDDYKFDVCIDNYQGSKESLYKDLDILMKGINNGST